ncbi:pyridoxamine 5'-phosphate oxidase [Flexivirga endophytica]|uniref:Pyridoxamine 5'-phosphate oxidase n=1 Tax=Flexivirga endophytica TaxID=1849103 RepID=A0A916WW52_9MICO|nr:pyridoxamine 5'-phosphate oxidase family protein [Flexivirga endophytica]GGB34619.1 pyridoxamine 5'-phosphate oxidase [Flexivirga endophytica]GHB42542.1 pyridoxamine 5'-phosphate oxidase [Flexivirga endophytica]
MNSQSSGSVSHLSAGECWELVRSASVGRLAVTVDDRPDIFPLNHWVDHQTVVVRTGAGTKLAGAIGHHVAFEVDGYDEDSREAWSVVIKGFASSVEQLHDVLHTLQLPLVPWQEGAKPFFVRIEPGTISGRRFRIAGADRADRRHRDR